MAATSTSKKVQVGDSAPDFTLLSQSGKKVSLKSLNRGKAVVLFFYPKDDTPGCTAESCNFRDNYSALKKAGAEVVGISSDSIESHSQFADKYSLPFTLLSDPDGEVRQLYQVPSTLGILPGRVTYVIDKKGIVQKVFSSQFRPKAHVDEALKALAELS